MLAVVMVLFKWGKKRRFQCLRLGLQASSLILCCAEHDFGRGFCHMVSLIHDFQEVEITALSS